MKLISLLDHLAAPATPAATPRRQLLRHLGQAAVAALPLAWMPSRPPPKPKTPPTMR